MPSDADLCHATRLRAGGGRTSETIRTDVLCEGPARAHGGNAQSSGKQNQLSSLGKQASIAAPDFAVFVGEAAFNMTSSDTNEPSSVVVRCRQRPEVDREVESDLVRGLR